VAASILDAHVYRAMQQQHANLGNSYRRVT